MHTRNQYQAKTCRRRCCWAIFRRFREFFHPSETANMTELKPSCLGKIQSAPAHRTVARQKRGLCRHQRIAEGAVTTERRTLIRRESATLKLADLEIGAPIQNRKPDCSFRFLSYI